MLPLFLFFTSPWPNYVKKTQPSVNCICNVSSQMFSFWPVSFAEYVDLLLWVSLNRKHKPWPLLTTTTVKAVQGVRKKPGGNIFIVCTFCKFLYIWDLKNAVSRFSFRHMFQDGHFAAISDKRFDQTGEPVNTVTLKIFIKEFIDCLTEWLIYLHKHFSRKY